MFGPLRDLLMDTIDGVLGIVAGFDPQKIIDPIIDLIQVLTDILGSPELLNVVEQLKAVLETANKEMNKFFGEACHRCSH